MSLRPRYSLLTLLVLTALIAGGVKLWYGPHHVVLINPTSAELKDLTHAQLQPYTQTLYSPGTIFEYRYRNTWSGRELLTLQCNYPKPLPLITQSFSSPRGDFLLAASIVAAYRGEYTSDGDEGVCWISGKLELLYEQNLKTRDFSHSRYGPAYVVTSRKKIYRTELSNLQPMFFNKIELDEIPNAVVRAQVQNVIAALPDPQPPQ